MENQSSVPGDGHRSPTMCRAWQTVIALPSADTERSERLLRRTINNHEKAWTLDRLATSLRAAIVDSGEFSDPSSVIRDEHRRFIDCSFRGRRATIYIVGDPVNDWSQTIDISSALHVPVLDYIFRFRFIRHCHSSFDDASAALLARLGLIDDNPKNG